MHEVQAPLLRLQPARTLGTLIAMYESNYVRIMRLAPELDDIGGTVVSRVAGALDLYLSVLERFKYTTTVSLTYRFDEDPLGKDGCFVFEPRARIRIYHDARAVEVLSHCRRRASRQTRPWRRGHMPELDRKWELNRFLQKWLGFCMRQGHLFLRCTSVESPAEEAARVAASSDLDGCEPSLGLLQTSPRFGDF